VYSEVVHFWIWNKNVVNLVFIYWHLLFYIAAAAAQILRIHWPVMLHARVKIHYTYTTTNIHIQHKTPPLLFQFQQYYGNKKYKILVTLKPIWIIASSIQNACLAMYKYSYWNGSYHNHTMFTFAQTTG